MIGGMVAHDGHPALAVHLGKLGDNESIAFRTHGLSADTITGAIAELRLMATGCRSTKPLIHSWASPSQAYSEADWENHRTEFEAEFGLEGFPLIEVFHLKYGKGGRTAGHVHRVYLRIDIDGKAARTSHSAIRMEKVSRIAEHAAGERFTSGCFNKAVITRLMHEGRHDVAEAMVRAGLDKAEATAAPASTERAMTERLNDLAADEVWRRAATAWRQSDNGAAFKAALAESGLRLAMGKKCAVLVSPGGAVHPLLRAVNKGGERLSGQAVRKAELDSKLIGLILPAAEELGDLPGFDPGAFTILNLDRLPIVPVTEPTEAKDHGHVAPPRSDHVRQLTAEQEAALTELEAAFHSTAADRARMAREAIEAEIVEEVSRRRAEALRLRIEAEKASWALPGIGVSGWRDAYRAELVGLPRKYGAHLRWVERLDGDTARVVLKSGAAVRLSARRAWSEKSGDGTIAVMIAHARERGWTSVTITGSVQWRVNMARAATRAGLIVSDADLHPTVREEQLRIRQEKILRTWWQRREALIGMSPQERTAAQSALLNLLAYIAGRSEMQGLITDLEQRRKLAADLDAYARYQQKMSVRELHPADTTSPPKPG